MILSLYGPNVFPDLSPKLNLDIGIGANVMGDHFKPNHASGAAMRFAHNTCLIE